MGSFTKKEMLRDGKAKRLYSTDDPARVIIEYKDSFSAFNGAKRAEAAGKGRLNNLISADIFAYLAENGVSQHFAERIDETGQLVIRVNILPVEAVVRNITAGSICKRLGVDEGKPLRRPLVEFYYKDDALGDPIITEDHALLFGWAKGEEITEIKGTALRVNDLLKNLFASIGVVLADFKLEFGRDSAGTLLLADEISPDTCRLWDSETGEKLDKDRFREDMGDVLGAYEAYEEIWKRLSERSR